MVYPPPLLDWTKSPYIAAFFAFSNALEHASERDSTYVRIFGITREFYKNKSPPTVILPFIEPYVCCLSISSLNNPRLYAQQGQFLVTNVHNLSTLLNGIDVVSGKKSLCAVDMPITIAAEVLEDLSYMGLTAANLFPGFDGVSKMIRHEMEFKRKSNIVPQIDLSESASTSMLQNEFKK